MEHDGENMERKQEPEKPHKGKPKIRQESLWKRNVKKANVAAGINRKFTFTTSCCQKFRCHTKFDIQVQKHLYAEFRNRSKTKQIQDKYLLSCMKPVEIQTHLADPKVRNHSFRFKFFLKVENGTIEVCQIFLCKLYNISNKRLRVIQRRYTDGDTMLEERRGCHFNRPKKMKPNVMELFFKHLNSIPSEFLMNESSSTLKRYFQRTDLSVKKLYDLFREYYFQETNEVLQNMTYNTYHRTFRKHSNIGFRTSKTDVCNTYSLSDTSVKLEKSEEENYSKEYDEYMELKTEILSLPKESSLIVELDYFKDIGLPKLDNCERFFEPLWFYTFNIHNHTDDTSRMYSFLETQAEKNADSVVSFLFHYLQEQLSQRRISKIILLSDAANSLIRNITTVYFCLWFSRIHNVEIQHVFSVQGHSFNACIHSSDLFQQSIESLPRVTHVDPILKNLVSSQVHSTESIFDSDILEQWNNALSPFFQNTSNFKIQSFVQLKYDGINVYGCSQYTECALFWRKFTFWVNDEDDYRTVELDAAIPYQISNSKRRTIETLYQYLSFEELAEFRRLFDL